MGKRNGKAMAAQASHDNRCVAKQAKRADGTAFSIPYTKKGLVLTGWTTGVSRMWLQGRRYVQLVF